MAGVSESSADQQRHKQVLLDYFSEHLGEAHTAEELGEATGISCEEAEVAAEVLAYENEIAKEYLEGGQKVYRRKA